MCVCVCVRWWGKTCATDNPSLSKICGSDPGMKVVVLVFVTMLRAHRGSFVLRLDCTETKDPLGHLIDINPEGIIVPLPPISQ